MIKENHISAEGNLENLVKKAIKTRKSITVEIENISQLKQILALKFKRILFDNMNMQTLRKCLKLCKNKYETEYSGNVNLENIRQISNTNVDRVSIGYLTHSADAFDLSLLFYWNLKNITNIRTHTIFGYIAFFNSVVIACSVIYEVMSSVSIKSVL